MRVVGVCLVLSVVVSAARCAPGGEEAARLLFGSSSSQEAAPAPRTVTRLVLRREWVTSTTPSSCVVVQTALPACRNLRHLGAHLRPSATVTRIEPTRAATLDEVEGGAEGRTFGWFRGSTTEPAPAPQVVSGRTPALVLPDTVVGGEAVRLVVQEQAQPMVLAAQPGPPLTRTLLLQQANRPAAAQAQLVYASPQDSAQVFVVEQAPQPQPQLQQVYFASPGDQQTLQGGTIFVEGAQPQQQVAAPQQGDKSHRYTLIEWLGLASPAAPAGGAASVLTVHGTLVQTATRAHYDPQHVVTFSVTGCEPTRLPFDLDYCEGHRPSKGGAAKGAPGKNVITIQEGAAEK